MRISGSTPPPLPAVTHARPSGRPDASGPAEAAAPSAPVSIPETPEPDSPPESGEAHGLVRAAEHSHRSDVAALRQWINHPDLRSDLPLPDLSTEHNGKGFEKAVAAYQAIIGAGSTPATDPAPVVTNPAPVGTDPFPS